MTLDLPAAMDGTWALRFYLTQGARIVTGTALLILANGVDFLYSLRGRLAGHATVLTLAGHAADPPPPAIQIRTTVETLEGGQAGLRALSGTAYGQVLAW